MIGGLLHILFPESCPLCGKPSKEHSTAPICNDCWKSVSPYEGPSCLKCGRPLVSDVSITCRDCLEREPHFERVRSFGIYDGVLKKAITVFKYGSIRRLSKPLSAMMSRVRIPAADILLPVPLHERRLREREFNQSALLAKHLSRHTGIPVSLDSLIRTRDTAPQAGLSAGERRKNIRNAFYVQENGCIKGKNIILVDDVFTTGATLRECSRVLKRSGSENIYAVTLAHSMLE